MSTASPSLAAFTCVCVVFVTEGNDWEKQTCMFACAREKRCVCVCVCVLCVCVCVREISGTVSLSARVCARTVRVGACDQSVCACLCVCMSVHVCVLVCTCANQKVYFDRRGAS